jgi:hypothetical protein
MTQTAYTEGPWSLRVRKDTDYVEILGPKGEELGLFNDNDGNGLVMFPSVENARLAAAAPELLGALENLEKACQFLIQNAKGCLEMHQNVDLDSMPDAPDWLRFSALFAADARTLIAKVKGDAA